MIQSIETCVTEPSFPRDKLFAVPLLTAVAAKHLDKVPPISKMRGGAELRAYVISGAWRVKCPFCEGTQLVAVTDPWFHCAVPECLNGGPATGLMWKALPVALPTTEDMIAIEVALLLRPSLKTRNWAYPETPQDLFAENAAHGVSDYHKQAVIDVVTARWAAMEVRA